MFVMEDDVETGADAFVAIDVSEGGVCGADALTVCSADIQFSQLGILLLMQISLVLFSIHPLIL